MSSAEFSRRSRAGLVCSKKISISYLIILLFLVSAVNVCASDLIKPLLASAAPQTLDMAPSRPLSQPGTSGPQFGGGMDAVPLSSNMLRAWLPVIPNLQFGFNYLFGRNLSQTWWSADYVLPISITTADMVFAEAHANSANSASTGNFPFLNNFWKQGPAGLQNRIDLSLGLGYRKFLNENVLVGAYGFFDTTRLSGSWKSAGSIGFQAAMNGPGDSAVDLSFNYYSDSYIGYDSRGSVFPTFNMFGAIAEGRGNYDFEAGASQPLFNRSYDLRVKMAGYQYDMGNSKIYGLRSGADITTADGVFKVSAEYGNDKLVGQYGQIGAYINIGFQAENIFKGENPFTKPEPIFRSPRNLRQFASQPVKRNWRKPSAVIANAKCTGLPDDSQFITPENRACFYTGKGAWGKCEEAYLTDGYINIGRTPGGQWTDAYANQYPHPMDGTSIYDYKRDIEPMFQCSSAAFARMATGTVRAYVGWSEWYCTDSVFWKVELPILVSRGITVELWSDHAVHGTWVQEAVVPNCGF